MSSRCLIWNNTVRNTHRVFMAPARLPRCLWIVSHKRKMQCRSEQHGLKRPQSNTKSLWNLYCAARSAIDHSYLELKWCWMPHMSNWGKHVYELTRAISGSASRHPSSLSKFSIPIKASIFVCREPVKTCKYVSPHGSQPRTILDEWLNNEWI